MMFHESQRSEKSLLLFIILLLILACSTSPGILPTQSSGTATPPFSPEQVGSAVAMTLTAIPSGEASPAATMQSAIPTSTANSSIFVPGNPTATPLGGEITDPNFIAGLAAFDANDYQRAVDLMTIVIASHPELAPPYRYRATSYWYLDKCELGLADAEKAIAINPNYAAAWAARGILYMCLGDDIQKMQSYEKALSLDPSLAFVHINIGLDYYHQGDYEKSLEEFELAVAIDPTRSDAWGAMGEPLFMLGRYDECIANTTKAIELKAELWSAYADRATCYMGMANYHAAAADYKTYVAQVTDNSRAWYNYGIAQKKLGDFENAEVSYTRALELEPNYYPAYINRGNVYIELKLYQKALDDFNAALELGNDPLAYSGRGDAYYWMKKYNQAIAEYETSLSIYPGSAHCHCFLAFSYFELGNYEEVFKEAETSYEFDPACGGAKLFEVQARSYYALKDYDQALTYINKALGTEQYALGYYYRGIIYQAAGRDQEAIQDLEYFLSVATTSVKEAADAKARLKQLKP